MKIRKKQLEKLKEVLAGDKQQKNDDFISLLERDLISVLQEYFEFEDKPFCSLKREENSVYFSISIKAQGIKTFGIIP